MSDKLCVCGLSNATVGSVVLHADHLAAMAAASAFDEDKERALFEAGLKDRGPLTSLHRNTHWRYIVESVQSEWQGWLACAKARAKAGGE
jgi:hypothetical protein